MDLTKAQLRELVRPHDPALAASSTQVHVLLTRAAHLGLVSQATFDATKRKRLSTGVSGADELRALTWPSEPARPSNLLADLPPDVFQIVLSKLAHPQEERGNATGGDDLQERSKAIVRLAACDKWLAHAVEVHVTTPSRNAFERACQGRHKTVDTALQGTEIRHPYVLHRLVGAKGCMMCGAAWPTSCVVHWAVWTRCCRSCFAKNMMSEPDLQRKHSVTADQLRRRWPFQADASHVNQYWIPHLHGIEEWAQCIKRQVASVEKRVGPYILTSARANSPTFTRLVECLVKSGVTDEHIEAVRAEVVAHNSLEFQRGVALESAFAKDESLLAYINQVDVENAIQQRGGMTVERLLKYARSQRDVAERRRRVHAALNAEGVPWKYADPGLVREYVMQKIDMDIEEILQLARDTKDRNDAIATTLFAQGLDMYVPRSLHSGITVERALTLARSLCDPLERCVRAGLRSSMDRRRVQCPWCDHEPAGWLDHAQAVHRTELEHARRCLAADKVVVLIKVMDVGQRVWLVLACK